jgi:predicted HTH transcriptional regulator
MNLQQLRKMVKQGEGQLLEFKKKADHPDKIVKELVAFANSQGGTLLIGVDDNGSISGLKFPEEEKFAMEAAIFRYAKPQLPFSFEQIPTEDKKEVLAIHVLPGEDGPYYWLCDKQTAEFKAFVRHKDQSLKASAEMFRVLKNRKHPRSPILRFSELEQTIFKELEEKNSCTLLQLKEASGLSKGKISNLLVHWVLSGVLDIQPGEFEDLYSLSEAYRHI